RSANLHFLDISRVSLHIEIDAARTVNEVALFDHKLKPAVLPLETQNAMMDQITSQRSARTAGRRIFRDVVGWSKDARMCTRGANFERLTREGETTRSTMTSVDLGKQGGIDTNVAQVCKRSHRNRETRETGRDHLYRQTLTEIFTIQS